MAFSAKTKELMEDPAFLAKLDKTESVDEFKAAFAAEGVDYDAEFIASEDEEADVELSAEELENVAGGRMSAKEITKMVINAAKKGYKTVKGGPSAWWKFGSSIAILSKAYYDILVHDDVFYTYNQAKIENAMKAVDCS